MNNITTFSLKKLSGRSIGLIGIAICLVTATAVYAASTVRLSLTIAQGNLSVDIRTITDETTVADPAFEFDEVTVNPEGQNATGEIPATTDEIFIDNLDAADAGWTLTIAPTTGANGALWQVDGGDSTLTINDTTTGLMTIDASSATFEADCESCVVTNIAKGSEASFAAADPGNSVDAVDTITLLDAAEEADDIGAYTLTGVDITQSLPGGMEAGAYTLQMTLTIATK